MGGRFEGAVRPELVVEIRCSDLLASDAEDQPIRRMALTFDATAGYRPAGEQITAVMLPPTFVRERPDKQADLKE